MVTLKDILETAAHYALLSELADILFKNEGITITDGVAECEDLSPEDLDSLNLLLQSAKNVLNALDVQIDINNLDFELPNKAPCNKPRVMGYGIMAEYCKLDNNPKDIHQWARRYEDALAGKN